MLYQITDGTVSAGGNVILSHIDFEIKGKEKIAVVGRNGAGKTTLLRLIAGELGLDRDDKSQGKRVTSSRKLTIGMLEQSNPKDQDRTVEELLLRGCPAVDAFSRERFEYEMEYDRIFTGFGFAKEAKSRKLSTFSGGEQTKISLICLLLMKPDILLLDEPTNHLDIPTVEWLEEYLISYDRAVVFVSHDRFFLDQVVDVVYELKNHKLKRYSGNYTQYRAQKVKDIALQRKAYARQEAELIRLNELVEKFKHKPKKAAFARSRKTIMERMERMEKPDEDEVHLFTGALEPKSLGGKWVYEAEHLKIGYDKPLLELSLRVRRGQKIGIIGDNGVGKSTFLKTVAGLLNPVKGKGELGNHIELGYFDQQTALITSDKQVVEHFHDQFPAMTEKEVRQTLGAYLFAGKDASKKVTDLSGGEKARLMLAELLTARPNFLVLDEPTNHMDIQAKETLESAFSAYTGTILFVSHDRYFIRQVADAILLFTKEGVLYYPFGYEHYDKRRRQGNGENLSAMIQAEEQAMMADFKAVPKAERHRLREIGTEEAYLDWKLGLAAEPMEEARGQVERLWNQLEAIQEQQKEIEWDNYLSTLYPSQSQEKVTDQAEGQIEDQAEQWCMEEVALRLRNLTQEYEQAWENWHIKCMEWLDVFMEE